MNKNNYKININNMITLCHILDEFKAFEERLLPIISPEYNRDFVFQLWDISRGKFTLGAIKARKFYRENKSIIDIINDHSNVPTFINQGYGYHGEPEDNLQFFYQYLMEHRSKVDQIIAILQKIKALGFSSLEFNESLDFTSEQYKAYSTFDNNTRITYVDNIEGIPHYESYIKYRTRSSNYKMELGVGYQEFYQYNRTIILNSLTFNPNRLPEKIDKETIFEPISKLKEDQVIKSIPIRNSVDIGVSIYDLELRLGYTTNTISKLEGVQNKKELLEILVNMKQEIDNLKILSEQYDSSVAESNPSITPQVLSQEKTLYLRKREWEQYDID